MGAIGWRRVRLAAVGAGILVAGLTVHELGSGAVAAFAGDALYAALVCILLAIVWPRARPLTVASGAYAFCAAIEVFQLTPVPGELSRTIPGASLVLGSTFQWSDLVAYALGAALFAASDLAVESALTHPVGRRVG